MLSLFAGFEVLVIAEIEKEFFSLLIVLTDVNIILAKKYNINFNLHHALSVLLIIFMINCRSVFIRMVMNMIHFICTYLYWLLRYFPFAF